MPRRATAVARAAPRTRPLPDWDALTFSFSETDFTYRACGDLGRERIWDDGELLPYQDVTLSPAAAFFGYGIGVFEGLKARRTADGRVLIFRHRDNARRFQRSAKRLVMPPFPEESFVQAVEQVVRQNERFIPPPGKGSFYVRPMQHAIEAQLGIRPSSKFWVLIFGSPVGGYFSAGADFAAPRGLRLRVVEQGRCAAGGTGSAKAAGNYAGGIAIAQQFKLAGFDDVLYLDAQHVRYLTETSGSNVFVKLRNGTLLTPPLDDQILPGITRDSVIQLARSVLGQTVEERPIPIEEVLQDGAEVFCSGTAYTVRNVDEVVYRDRSYSFSDNELQRAILTELLGIQRGEREDRFGWVSEV